MPSSSRLQSIRDISQLLAERSGSDVDMIDRALGTSTSIRRATDQVLAPTAELSSIRDERALSRAFEKLIAATVNVQVGPPFDSRPWTDVFRCMRDMLAVRVMIAYGYRGPSYHVTIRLLSRARRAQFTAIELMCLFYVRVHWALNGKLHHVERLTAEISALQHIYALELEAEGWEDAATALVASRRVEQPLRIRQLESMARKAEALRRTHDRWVFHATAFRLRSRALQLRDDWHGALAVCDDAVQYYRTHPDFSSPSRVGEFVLRSMVCLTNLNDLKGAHKRAELARPLLAVNVPMWIVVLEFTFQLGMRASNLVYAAQVCKEARLHHKRALTQARRELWRFREIAVHILARYYPAAQSSIIAALGPPRFYINNIERHLPSVATDKLGSHAQFMYLRVLSYVDAKRYADVVELRESIGLYVKRHLLGAPSQRTATFMRMLMRLPTYDFDADRCQKACQHFVRRLQEDLPTGNDVAELIPYDVLWRAVLDVLRRNAADDRRRR